MSEPVQVGATWLAGNFCHIEYLHVPTQELFARLEQADEEGARFTAGLIREELMRRQPALLEVEA